MKNKLVSFSTVDSEEKEKESYLYLIIIFNTNGLLGVYLVRMKPIVSHSVL